MKKTQQLKKMSQAQESKLALYCDKWIAIGMATEDYKTTDGALHSFVADVYAAAKLPAPKVLRAFSPFAMQIAANMIDGDVMDQVADQVRFQVADHIWGQVRGQVGEQVADRIADQVRSQVGAQVGDQVRSQVADHIQVRSQVGDHIWAQVGAHVGAQVGAQVRAQVANARIRYFDTVWGNQEYWLSLYDFFQEVVGLDLAAIRPLIELCKRVGWFVPLGGFCIVSERPLVLERDRFGRLHREGGPAMAWRDGYTLHALFGVRFAGELAKKFVDMPVSEINPKDVLEIKNVEQRSAVIRRIGVEKFAKLLPTATLDKMDAYKLLSIDVAGRQRIYLQMENPSIEETHIEGVHPECRTVAQALSWRNFGDHNLAYAAPQQLT